MKNRRFFSLAGFVLVSFALLVAGAGLGWWAGRWQSSTEQEKGVSTSVVVVPTQATAGGLSRGAGLISGRVWHDLCAVSEGEDDSPPEPSAGCVEVSEGNYRANGKLEPGEPVLGGVFVQLGAGACPASGLGTATTDSTGVYSFTNLSPGTYCVSVNVSSPQNASLLPGDWTMPPTFIGAGSRAGHTISLGAGEHRGGVDFGWDYHLLPPPDHIASDPDIACTDVAAFISSVTIPDGVYVTSEQPFVKTWRLRNVGTCTWTKEYSLVFVSGDKMGNTVSEPLAVEVLPGKMTDLSVSLMAPVAYGPYESKWLLQNAEGERFGIAGDPATGVLFVRIVVGYTPTGWRAEYFDNPNLADWPALTRNDAAVNFDWGLDAPVPEVPSDGFSVRWTRIVPMMQGLYRFYAYSDDGVRVWLDGNLILDQWRGASEITFSAERTLTEGEHTFRVEYYEGSGAARVRFWWVHLDEFPQWKGEYFDDTELVGDPALVRNDSAIDFDWGRYRPVAGVGADEFSVRWRRVVMFEEGQYRFYVRVDGGVRLWVDGVPVIDDWEDGDARELTAELWLPAGHHAVRIEYFDKTGDALIQVGWEGVVPFPNQ